MQLDHLETVLEMPQMNRCKKKTTIHCMWQNMVTSLSKMTSLVLRKETFSTSSVIKKTGGMQKRDTHVKRDTSPATT